MEDIHSNQVEEVLPHQYEPTTTENSDDDINSDSDSESSSDEEVVDEAFEVENAWRLQSLKWCKCGHCKQNTKAVESFCCHEKALEYDALLSEAEAQGDSCLTCLPDFIDNMLSAGVLKIDGCRYLEESWPLDDADIEKTHKLYRLVAYQRCSRWVFQILGKKKRRPFPSCVYTKIREKFSSADGLYTHFKYTKLKPKK